MLIVVIMSLVIIVSFVIIVVFDFMPIDTDATIVAAANACPNSCCITARADDSNRRNLRHEDQVALGICRDRVRVRRLRDLLD